MKRLTFSLLLMMTTNAYGEDINFSRAHFNYQMFCQGCHTPDGSGAQSVPRMKDFVGLFLESKEGREFLVRVPGSATSSLDSKSLAEVLNWIVLEFSGDSAGDDFLRYSEAEVAQLRQHPLNEVTQYRARLLAQLYSNRTAE